MEWPHNLLLDLNTDTDCGVEERDFTDYQMDGLIYVLDVLSERQRVSVYLKYLEGMNYQELADIFSISEEEEAESIVTDALSVMKEERYTKYYRLGLYYVTRLKKADKIINIDEWKKL